MSKFSLPKDHKAFKLSEEAALAEVARILQFYSYDIDNVGSKAVQDQAEVSLEAITRAFRLGTLEIKDGAGMTIIQHLTNGEAFEFKEFRGDAKVQLDKVPGNETNRRMHTLLGFLAGIDATAFQKLPLTDLAVSEALAFVFLSR